MGDDHRRSHGEGYIHVGDNHDDHDHNHGEGYIHVGDDHHGDEHAIEIDHVDMVKRAGVARRLSHPSER